MVTWKKGMIRMTISTKAGTHEYVSKKKEVPSEFIVRVLKTSRLINGDAVWCYLKADMEKENKIGSYIMIFGTPIYRGNHEEKSRQTVDGFDEVLKIMSERNDVMEVDTADRSHMIFHWEDGWREESLVEYERELLGTK